MPNNIASLAYNYNYNFMYDIINVSLVLILDAPIKPSVTGVSSVSPTVLEVTWIYDGFINNVDEFRLEIQVCVCACENEVIHISLSLSFLLLRPQMMVVIGLLVLLSPVPAQLVLI